MNKSHFELDKSAPTGESLRQACDFCRKITLKLELTKCDHCPGNHCLYHRHQVQHSCPKLADDARTRELEEEARRARRTEALDRLRETQRDLASKSQTPLTAQSQAQHAPLVDTKKQALARRVRIMKIRQSARGPPNILDSDKIYFEVKFVHEPKSSLSFESRHGKIVNIYTTSKHTVGRMIDWSADQLDVTNKNHIEGNDQLIFRKQAMDGQSHVDLDSQVAFEKYIDSAVLQSGDELHLTYLVNLI